MPLNKAFVVQSAAPVNILDAGAWVPSGALTASTVIKASPGVLGGVVVTASDDGGDIDVIVWDSATATSTNKEQLARVTITAQTAKAQESIGTLGLGGIVASEGLWLQVAAGDCSVIVYYK